MDNETAWLIGLTGMFFVTVFIFTFAMIGGWVYLQNLDKKDLQIQTEIVSERTLTQTELAALRNETDRTFGNIGVRFDEINAKLDDISLKQAALQAQIAAMNETERLNLTSFNSTIQRMQMQLAFQYAILLKLNNTNASYGTGNTTEPEALPPYADLQCYKDLRQRFGQYLNLEWLCNAAQVVPDYIQWNAQACSCAREAGLNV